MTKVKELMTRAARACRPSDTLDDAVGAMLAADCGSLPVVAAKGRGDVVGVITDRDVCVAAHRLGKKLAEIQVQEAMSRGVITCGTEDDVTMAGEAMRRAKVRRLPVVDFEGRLQGMLTLGQLTRASGSGKGLDPERLTATFRSILERTAGPRLGAVAP